MVKHIGSLYLSQGSDEPAQMRRLARAYAARIQKHWELMKTLTKKVRPLVPLDTSACFLHVNVYVISTKISLDGFIYSFQCQFHFTS